jgi:hypothetical protein
MAIFEDRFIKGSRFTQHFTLDDPSDQVVPKAGTDTVPGALALNLGNNLPGDTTNATDALTAAGFNAMANQVDSTDPFCGNAIQQAVTVAVGQSIGCDAAAQEAIACAIASNPEAVACLAAALPSGCDDSGTILLDALTTGAQATALKWENGVTTELTVPRFPVTDFDGVDRGRYQNPGKLTGILNYQPYALDPLTNTYSVGSALPVHQRGVLNQEGTRIALIGFAGNGKTYSIGANGTTTALTSGVATNAEAWFAEDLIGVRSGGVLSTINATNNTSGTVDFTPISNPTYYAVSSDYGMYSEANVVTNTVRVLVRSLARSGNNITSTLIGEITSAFQLPVLPGSEGAYYALSTWTPDNSQLVVLIGARDVSGATLAPSLQRFQHASFVVNVTPTGLVVDPYGVYVSGNTYGISAPRISGDGNYMITTCTSGIAIFKKSGTKWRQIGTANGYIGATIIGGSGGYSARDSM